MNSIKLTFTNNSGLLFTYKGINILIDGLVEEKNTFDSPSQKVKEYVEKNVFASNSKNILFFTHCHDDHFSDVKVFQTKEKNVSLVVFPRDKCASKCIAATHEDSRFVVIDSQSDADKVNYNFGDISVRLIRTKHLPYQGLEDVLHFSIFLNINGKGFLVAADTDPCFLKDLLNSLQEKVNYVFYNPVILGRKAYIECLDKVDELIVYHLPSAESDNYNYRKMAITMAKKYEESNNFKIKLLLDKLYECII